MHFNFKSAAESCRNFFCCIQTQTADEILSGEELLPQQDCKHRLHNFFTNSTITCVAGAGTGSGVTVSAIGIVASKMGAGAAGMAAVIGVGTTPWIVMTVVGGVSAGILTGSAVSYFCCSDTVKSSDGWFNSFEFNTSRRKPVTGLSSYEGGVYTYGDEDEEYEAS